MGGRRWLIAVIVLLCCVGATMGEAGLYLRTPIVITVVSGTSMLPTLHPGDLVVCARWVPIRVGRIYIVWNHGIPLVHRIIRIYDGMVVTKGDNNPAPDPPVPISHVVCGVVTIVPVEVWTPLAGAGLALALAPAFRALARAREPLAFAVIALATATVTSAVLAYLAMKPFPPAPQVAEMPAATVVTDGPWWNTTITVYSNGRVLHTGCDVGRSLGPRRVDIVIGKRLAEEAYLVHGCRILVNCTSVFSFKGVTWLYRFSIPIQIPFSPPTRAVAFFNGSGTFIELFSKKCTPATIVLKYLSDGHVIDKRIVGWTCGVYRVSEKIMMEPITVIVKGCGGGEKAFVLVPKRAR